MGSLDEWALCCHSAMARPPRLRRQSRIMVPACEHLVLGRWGHRSEHASSDDRGIQGCRAMLRDVKRVRNRVAVLPTMAAHPMALETSRHAEPARSAREDAPKSRGRTAGRAHRMDLARRRRGRPTNSRRLHSQRVTNLQCPRATSQRPWRRRLTTWTTLVPRGGGCPKSL